LSLTPGVHGVEFTRDEVADTFGGGRSSAATVAAGREVLAGSASGVGGGGGLWCDGWFRWGHSGSPRGGFTEAVRRRACRSRVGRVPWALGTKLPGVPVDAPVHLVGDRVGAPGQVARVGPAVRASREKPRNKIEGQAQAANAAPPAPAPFERQPTTEESARRPVPLAGGESRGRAVVASWAIASSPGSVGPRSCGSGGRARGYRPCRASR